MPQITNTLWTVAVLYCAECDRDLARVTAREDYFEDMKGTLGVIGIDHMKKSGHGVECRSVQTVTWDQVPDALDATEAPFGRRGA